ncbi:unnamed protein product [Cylicostephanus goldi]|uniref:Uncharacterized protein n=1 Tax=Cylicostephanus goldi TaxID=71465 RepID=A0A3P7M9M0_CYLGO|nr:unnamed protein product [Cylicostephanus goldi]
MLFLMLVFLVFAIAVSRWRMDKIFGTLRNKFKSLYVLGC